MTHTVTFREFQERDIDFVFQCKNDEKLNRMIVKQSGPFSRDDAAKWVHGCMGEHKDFRFWAVCTNDEEQRIVGWVSLSSIDYSNKSACFHGIVIGDKDYNDGFAWIESYLFIMNYVFEVLSFNRLYGSSIIGNVDSNNAALVFLWTKEGVMRQAIYRNDVFYDVKMSSILRD
jgi:RimJ/RimL family protein N-acetyltransferase